MADDSRAVRILSDLCGVLRREKNILEFGYVYCPDPLYNKSPITVLDGNLGIDTWCIKLLYFHAYSQLFHNKCRLSENDMSQVRDCSMAVVLFNADCMSAWNVRKDLVLNKNLNAEEELKFCRLVLSKHPKSPETFTQRRWLLRHVFPSANSTKNASSDLGPAERERDNENSTLMAFVREEMDTCTLAASRYPSNYNAWSHRIWVIKHLAGNPPELLKSELESSKPWVCKNLSDHSGFHYRQYLLGTLMGLPDLASKNPCQPANTESPACLIGTPVLEELQLILELVTSYPGHEAVWYHRRYVVYLWKTLLCNSIRAESKETGECLEGEKGTVSSRIQLPSSNKESTRDCPVTEQLTGKRPSESQQIGNEPLGKRPSEDQPMGNQPFGDCLNENSPTENNPTQNNPTENDSNKDLELPSGIDKGCQAHSDKLEGASTQNSQFSTMHVSPQCHHDASLVNLSNQCLPDQSPLDSVNPNASLSASPGEKLFCSTKDAFSSREIQRLIQHEERFIKIVVESTHTLEKAAQKRCADYYRRWLENLHA